MINLLPPEIKSQYHYARYNRVLVHWAVAFVLAIVGLAVITTAGLVLMNSSISSYRSKIAVNQNDLQRDNSGNIDKQVSDISNNLKLMVQVLSKEILFSDLLARLGNATPNNVILTSLEITQDESAVDITAQTANYNSATQLQVNLADPANQIFSSADIEGIACATGNSIVNPNYPCTAEVKAQFLKNNPFLFINSNAKGGG